MRLTSDIVKWANKRMEGFMPGQYYGIAKSALKDDKVVPYADEKYIGIDDTYPAQMYHRELAIASTTMPGGFGDRGEYLQSTFTMAMVLYFDEKKTGYIASELYAFIQASLTSILKINGYRSVRVNVTSAILNDGSVWRQEYGETPLRLFDTQRLIQINYSIIAVVDKNCIEIPHC